MIKIKDQEYLFTLWMHIRKVRKQHGFTQESLAYAADLSLSQIGRIERGVINPTVCTLKLIADTIGINLSTLVNIQSEENQEVQ